MINEIQAKKLISLTEAHLKEDLNWEERDIQIGMKYVSLIFIIFTELNLPVKDKKFPSLLIAIANMLDLARSIDNDIKNN